MPAEVPLNVLRQGFMQEQPRPVFPFSAIVGQEEMKRALIACAIDASIGGVLVFGDRGTAKSTAVRALASVLPRMAAVLGCHYACDPDLPLALCDDCRKRRRKRTLRRTMMSAPVVELPLGATEDRVVGALDLEAALARGTKRFEPGILARANRGFLYIDEVNLLEDHLVDLLIDVAASGENLVERDGLSVRHPARFVLVGSGNPEEGELRPQLLDRFGLSVEVRTPSALSSRVEVIKRREAFDRDRAAFLAQWQPAEEALRELIVGARERLPRVAVSDPMLERMANLCLSLATDGLRAELTLIRAARAIASFENSDMVEWSHIKQVAPAALRHRLRRDPLDEAGSSVRVERALANEV